MSTFEIEGSSDSTPSSSPAPISNSCEESGLGVKKKRGEYKKRSPAWDHFQPQYVQGVRHVVCNYCTKMIAAD